MLRVGLLGVGNMGRTVLRKLVSGELGPYEVVLAVDVMGVGAEAAADAGVPFFTDARELLRVHPDLVVETASQIAVREWAEPILAAGINMVTLSVGALADAELLQRLERVAAANGAYLRVPSGAIGGLDVLKAASVAGLDSVELTTTKPPAALAGAPGLAGIDLTALTSPTVVFEGSAAEAASALPQNLNVAVAVALNGLGVHKTRVKVVADPNSSVNAHRVVAQGEFGRMEITVENLPSPNNPKTSYLAVLSAMALLRSLHARVQIGS